MEEGLPHCGILGTLGTALTTRSSDRGRGEMTIITPELTRKFIRKARFPAAPGQWCAVDAQARNGAPASNETDQRQPAPAEVTARFRETDGGTRSEAPVAFGPGGKGGK